MDILAYYIFTFLNLYYYVLIFYIIMSWVPAIRDSSFYKLLGMLCDPFFRIFRGWIVIGSIDFTPMVGLILYSSLLRFAVGL